MKLTLGELLQEIAKGHEFQLRNLSLSSPVRGVSSDSRAIESAYIFVAVRGTGSDGHRYFLQAEHNGALLCIGEDPPPHGLSVSYLQVEDSRHALAQLASRFYGNPADDLLVIGVTGTSGKTTTTYILESILQAAGHRVGLIGTVNFRIGTKVYPSTHTTPGAVELQKLLAQMKEDGCTAVVMEVSSHALKQKRTAFIAFDGVVFTNLSSEHLDYHSDMEDYYQSKALLFTEAVDFSVKKGKTPVGVINQEDGYGERLMRELSSRVALTIKGFSSKEGLGVTLDGISGNMDGISIQSPLTGQFNCANIAAAVRLAVGLNISKEAIAVGIKNLAGVPGRLERVPNQKGVHVWVDYAHKPDALEKVLQTLNAILGAHRLITVFGCGGDRDRKKRPLMGQIAVQGSHEVYVTSDNPRTEDPMAIIREILVEIEFSSKVHVEADRRKAIFSAIQDAEPGDFVLIAGKGHEDYQILGTKKIHFDDREVVSDAFRSIVTGNA